MTDTFRPQAESKPRYQIQEDFMKGLKTTTSNNQPLMALLYVEKAITSLNQRVAELEAETNDLRHMLNDTKKPTPRSAKTEDVASE